MSGIVVGIGVIMAAVALAGFTARTASERGRSRILWGTLSVVAGLAGWIAGIVLLAFAMHSDVDNAVGAVGFALIVAIAGPLGAMLLVLGAVWKLPERVPTLRGSSWAMDRLASRDVPAGPCALAFDGRALRVGDVALAPADVTELVADGECVRVSWSGGSVVLLPSGKERTPAERAKQSQAIEKRLRRLMGPTKARPVEPKAPYR